MRKRLWLFSLMMIARVAFSQSPGIIVRPASGAGTTILNPNGDGYSSATSSGFTTNDITQSEIPYFVVPPAITEQTGDVATGPSGGFTDIVKTTDNSGFYMYSDGVNLLFRLRIGNIISGSKGYSVLFDTDGKMGNAAPNADPNYIAATNTSNGNPGFEYEVVFETNFQVAVFNVDGSSNPGSPVATYALSDHSQISVALSTDGSNPDYFYDWYVPLTALGSPSSFRVAATTVTSPSSSLQGSRSDIYGIDDATSGVASAWTTVVNAQPTITVSGISSGGAGVSAVCTAAPVLNSPINTGSSISVTGTWTRMDATKPSSSTITLYKNGVSTGTTTVSTGNTWTIVVASVAAGDVFYAKAQAAGETQCLQSNNVTAGCSSTPVSPSITCASSKGVTGTIPLGSTVSIYQVTTANNSPTTTSLTTGLQYTNNSTDQTFNYYGTNPQSGNACQGQNGILTTNATYMLVTNSGGCLSAPTFICITGSSQNSWNSISSNALTLTTPIYPYQTSVSGSGATSGQLLRLFLNNQYVGAVTATGSTFTFSGLTLNTGDQLKVYAQASGACMSVSSAFTVSCYTAPPVITTNSSGNLLSSSTSISGTSAYSGATVSLYKGVSPSGTLVGTATVSSGGAWTVTGLTLVAADTYYATQTSGGCTSPSSASATVTGPTTVCPSFSATTFADNATTVGGTMSSFTGTIRLYLDGTLMGSSAVSAATSWSIAVNTTYTNTLYSGGVLSVTAQASGSAESTCSTTATVTCSSPTQPSITPTTTTINTGQTVTFTVSNVVANTWYAALDNSGVSYATSIYTSSSAGFNYTTNPFNTAGSYNLQISADKLTGCAKSYRTALITVNNASLPVRFVDVAAELMAGAVNVRWSVDNEFHIDHYDVEESLDGKSFAAIGSVLFREGTGLKSYVFASGRLPATFPAYYRVRQWDIDGHSQYSKVVMVDDRSAWKLNVTPNPTSGPIHLSIRATAAGPAQIRVITPQGITTRSVPVTLTRGMNIVVLPPLTAGVYEIVVDTHREVNSVKCIVL